MDSLLLEYTNLILNNVTGVLSIIILVALVGSMAFRDSILKFFRLFLYRDSATPELATSERKVVQIEKRIKNMEKELTEKVLSNKTALLEHELDKYLENNLGGAIEKRLSESDSIEKAVIGELQLEVHKETSRYLEEKTLDDIQAASAEHERLKRMDAGHASLVATLEKEERSASMLKMVMINVFVMATVMFIIMNIGKWIVFDKNTTIVVVSLYVSLGAFMLYIIRTSHFRTSVLLAIKEDERNYQYCSDYLSNLKEGHALSEHDVEVIRIIMTNRSERENKAAHPYEVILKGVTGSNIQFKGGKMSLGNPSKKTDG